MQDCDHQSQVSTALAVLGILAFVAGLTREWIIDPLASAFDSLSPDGKVVVVALLVTGVIGLVGAARLRRRRSVDESARIIASHDRP